MGHLNINSLRSKFELIKEVFFNIIDVFFLSETKLDETLSSNQFQIEGYKNLRMDRNCYGKVFVFTSAKYSRQTC